MVRGLGAFSRATPVRRVGTVVARNMNTLSNTLDELRNDENEGVRNAAQRDD